MSKIISSQSSRIQNAIKSLEGILIENEKLEALAVQHRLFALLNRRQILAATSGRLILMKRNLIIGYRIIAYRWQDIGEVNLFKGIFGADLTIKFFKEEDLSVNSNSEILKRLIGFKKEQTKAIYRIAQLQDQSWREKRRIRALEELRAKSGGFNFSSRTGYQENEPGSNNLEKLKQAQKMYEENLITDSEYEAIKARIINNL